MIRKVRTSQGLTIEQLALEANSDVGNLSRNERGVQCPSVEVVENIARALHMCMSSLFLMTEGDQISFVTYDVSVALIRNFKSLSDDHQTLVIDFIKLLKKQKPSSST